MTEEAERFWKEFEESTGERVEARCMGQWLGPDAPPEGVWGLLVLTDRSFHFQGQKSANWLTNLFGARSRSEGKPVTMVVPRESLEALKERPKGFMTRLLGPAFPRFSISWSLPDGGQGTASFEIDDRSGFMEALRKAMPA